MSEPLQIVLGFLFLVALFLLTRWFMVLKIRSTCNAIVKELEDRGAFDSKTAVLLPYDRPHLFKIGMRDYRPKALEALVQSGVIIKTGTGRYYLAHR